MNRNLKLRLRNRRHVETPIWRLSVFCVYEGWKVRVRIGSAWCELWGQAPGCSGNRLLAIGPKKDLFRHPVYTPEALIMGVLDKIMSGTAKPGVPVAMADEDFRKRYPGLVELMTASTYPDGSSRLPSAIVLFYEDGLFKGSVSDKSSESALWATGASLSAFLKTLEARVGEERPDWRRTAASRKRKT
jgi:hypothetical protein